jgi:hypothetical protein
MDGSVIFRLFSQLCSFQGPREDALVTREGCTLRVSPRETRRSLKTQQHAGGPHGRALIQIRSTCLGAARPEGPAADS